MTSASSGFCTQCGAPRAAAAQFCTSCGAPLGADTSQPAGATPARAAISPATVGALVVLLLAGGVSTWFALREDTAVQRAVPGAPAAAAPAKGGAPQAQTGLPQGHPGLELPAEVVTFLDQLTAEAENKPGDVEAHLRLARARYRASVLNSAYRAPAQQALDKLLQIDPANEEGIRISANLAYDRGEFAEAEKGFRRYLEKQPGDASALTDLGSALLFQNKPEEAVAHYRMAIDKQPDFVQARFNLGITLHRLGQTEEARKELDKASELAKEPQQKQHIENALAEIEGREPKQIAAGELPPDHPPVGGTRAGAGQASASGAPAPAASTAATNASTAYQRAVETLMTSHPIVGPRIRQFQWAGPASAKVMIAEFPMDKMPPVVRNKFKSGMNEKVAALAAQQNVSEPITLELVDPASGSVMDRLDGKEMVGAFDPQQ